MKTILFLLLSCLVVHAEDWTVGAKTYQNVTVTSVEADRVHITYNGGIGTIQIALLPTELQNRFSYDPAKAKDEAAARDAALAQAIADVAKEAPKPVVVAQTSRIIVTAKSPVNVEIINDRIANIQNDIAFMQKQVNLTRIDDYTRGGYAQKIAAEQAQIATLQAQLH